jgi:hypothetical protein
VGKWRGDKKCTWNFGVEIPSKAITSKMKKEMRR